MWSILLTQVLVIVSLSSAGGKLLEKEYETTWFGRLLEMLPDQEEYVVELDRKSERWVEIATGFNAFAGLTHDGAVVSWGSYFGGGDSSSVRQQLGSGVEKIWAGALSFVAKKSDGSIVGWCGKNEHFNTSFVNPQLLTDVRECVPALWRWACLTNSKQVFTAGPSIYLEHFAPDLWEHLENVEQLYSSNGAFLALHTDGKITTWGNADAGGDASSVQALLHSKQATSVFSFSSSFVVQTLDGFIFHIGNPDPRFSCAGLFPLQGTIEKAVSVDVSAFLLDNGVTYIWANRWRRNCTWMQVAGTQDIEAVGTEFLGVTSSEGIFEVRRETASNTPRWGALKPYFSIPRQQVRKAVGNRHVVVLLLSNQTVVLGGSPYAEDGGDASQVAQWLESNVSDIYATTNNQFLVVRNSTEMPLVTWGGTPSTFLRPLPLSLKSADAVYTTINAFLVLSVPQASVSPAPGAGGATNKKTGSVAIVVGLGSILVVLALAGIAWTVRRRTRRKCEHWDFFISYKQSSSRAKVLLIHEILTSTGYKVWLDCFQGQVALPEMIQGVRNSSVFLIYLSNDIFESEYVIREVTNSLAMGKPIFLVSDATFDVNSLSITPTCPRAVRVVLERLVRAQDMVAFNVSASTGLGKEGFLEEIETRFNSKESFRRPSLAGILPLKQSSSFAGFRKPSVLSISTSSASLSGKEDDVDL